MTTRTRDCKTFHFLIKTKQNKTKQKTKRIAQDLNVNGEIHTGDQAIMEGFRTHLQSLATQQKDHMDLFHSKNICPLLFVTSR